MYAIVKTGGKQYKVSVGDLIRVESLQVEVGSSIELEQVLLICRDGKTIVGSPLIAGAKVKASVVSVGREKKITVIKFRRRKDSRLKQGHRQYYTELKIDDIVSSASKKTTAENKTASKTESKTKEASKKAEKPASKKPTPKKAESKKATPKKTTAKSKTVAEKAPKAESKKTVAKKVAKKVTKKKTDKE